MKATGIVRRIDDLGRVVIPKEVPKDAADPGGHAAGDFYRPGGRDHPEKIFAHRGAGGFRRAVCGVTGPDHGADGVCL